MLFAVSLTSQVSCQLGAINNLAPHRPEAVIDCGGLEAALSVLEHAPTHTPRGGNISAAQEAASALIVGTAEASSRPSSAQPLGSPSRSILGAQPLNL